MAPVLSDVSVEWVFPESTEVLVSPVSSSCLFPGDRLVSYGVICDTSPYLSNPRSVSLRGCPGTGGCCWLCAWSGGVSCFPAVSLREVMGGTLGAVVAEDVGAACLGWEPVDRHGGGTCSLSVLPPRTRGGSTA